MSDDFFVREHKKLKILGTDSAYSIEIGDTAIDEGFLRYFPGSALSLFLYLITHMDDNHIIETNPAEISPYLPDNYTLEELNKDLTYLHENGIVDIIPMKNDDNTYQIKINTHIFGRKDNPDSKNNSLKLTSAYYNKQNIRNKIFSLSEPSRAELFQAILTFIPPEENILVLEKTITQWLEDFDTKMVKELIRRVDKWLNKYNNPVDKAFPYLTGIIDDWYQKGISSYQELQYFDNLYRETRELAELYGLSKWHNIKPVHMETFNRWLKEDYPLSVDVVKLAIQEAFQRKKDGQPSLQYIEENFIIPWKKNKVRNCNEARELLQKENSYTRTGVKKQSDKKEMREAPSFVYWWDNFSWDFKE